MNQTANSPEWQPCPSGEIEGVVARLRRRRQALQAARTSAVVLVLCAVIVPLWWSLSDSQHDYGGIACNEVRQLAPDFIAGRLDDATERKMEIHLAECPECGPLVEKMMARPGKQSSIVSWGRALAAHFFTDDCPCSHCRPAHAVDASVVLADAAR